MLQLGLSELEEGSDVSPIAKRSPGSLMRCGQSGAEGPQARERTVAI